MHPGRPVRILLKGQSSTVDRFTDFILLATTTTLIAYIYGAYARPMLIV